jgi:hypothetical protein
MKKAILHRILGSLILSLLFLNPLYSKKTDDSANTVYTVTSGESVTIEGDFTNNNGLVVEAGGYLVITGDLFSNASITIEEGGILIVYGDLSDPNSGAWGNHTILIDGNLIVLGDCEVGKTSIDSSNGNLVVGGDFSINKVEGSVFSNESLYILDPDASVSPSGIEGEYGTLATFEINENLDLIAIIQGLGLITPTSEIWTGEEDSDWTNGANWVSGEAPTGNEIEIKEGGIAPLIEGAVSFENFTIDANATLILAPGAALNVSESFVNNGEIILRSTPDAVSALNVPESNTNSGQGQIELSLEANQWYRLGQPIENPTGAIYDVSDQADSWIYRSENSWKRITSDDTPLDPMEGTMALYKSEHTVSYSGTLNTGEKSWDINYGKGYYLMANPFPGTMKWSTLLSSSGISLTNVSHTIYYRVYAGSQVGDYIITYNGFSDISTILEGTDFPSGYTASNIGNIAPLQSVWVQVTADETANITLDNRARITDNSMPLKSASLGTSTRDMIRITQKNQYVSDGTILYFDDNFSEGIDPSDSEKMFNTSKQVPEIYTRVENTSLSINGMPALSSDQYSIPLSIRNQMEGQVTLSINLDDLNNSYSVLLEDAQTETWTNLRETPEYTYTPDELGEDNDRFVLHLQKVTTAIADPVQIEEQTLRGITVTGLQTYARVNVASELLQQNSGEALVEVLDMNGRLVNQTTTNQEVTNVDLPNVSGIYVVRVQAGLTVKSEKIFVQNR